MFIVKVIPIGRGMLKEELSYFSSSDVPLGSVVSAPVRSKIIPALVLSSTKAADMKSEIKDMPFQVRKIDLRIVSKIFSPAFMRMAEKSSDYFASSIGALIASIVPKLIFESKITEIKEKTKKNPRFEENVLQMEKDDRFDIYRSIIRESFAKKESVAIFFPTEEGARSGLEKFSKGIEEFAYFVESKKIKEYIKIWKAVTDNKHAVLLCGTTSMIPLLTSDFGTIIIEEESSRNYKEIRRPFADVRWMLRSLAEEMGSKIIYGDKLLRIDTLARVETGEIIPYMRMTAKSRYAIKTLTVDMKKDEQSRAEDGVTRKKEIEESKKKFTVFSPELEEMIRYAEKRKEKVFILASRRGSAPSTICMDCGETVFCSRCDGPMTLHKGKEEPSFICHHCGEKRKAEDPCRRCGSWNLKSYGIGIEEVALLAKEISKKEVFLLDSDNAKTQREAKKITDEFLSKGGILIGTEMAHNYLPEKSIEYSAIVSLDSLFSLPDFRINERVMHLILKTKALATELFLLQARNAKHAVIEQGVSGDWGAFSKEELSLREKYGYPPFKTFIKLSIVGLKDSVKADAEKIMNLLEDYHPEIFPAFIKTQKGQTVSHILLRIPKNSWPDPKLRTLLLSLPPKIIVKVDPESLL